MDGVAPRAKFNAQRGSRFTKRDKLEKEQIIIDQLRNEVFAISKHENTIKTEYKMERG